MAMDAPAFPGEPGKGKSYLRTNFTTGDSSVAEGSTEQTEQQEDEQPAPLTIEDLRGMSPAELTEARHSGALAHLGVGRQQPDQSTELSREDLQNMTPDAIMKAKAEGKLDHLIGG